MMIPTGGRYLPMPKLCYLEGLVITLGIRERGGTPSGQIISDHIQLSDQLQEEPSAKALDDSSFQVNGFYASLWKVAKVACFLLVNLIK